MQGHSVDLSADHTQDVTLDIELSQDNVSALGMSVAPLGCSPEKQHLLDVFQPPKVYQPR